MTGLLRPYVITGPERVVLAIFAFAVVFGVGPVVGVILASSLEDDTLLPAYWTNLLTVQGVAALPLVAIAALASRGLVKEPKESQSVRWARFVLLVTTLAVVIAVSVIAMCLQQIALTPMTGRVAEDFVLYATAIGATSTICAIGAGLLGVALDKIDEPVVSQPPPSPPPPPPPPPA